MFTLADKIAAFVKVNGVLLRNEVGVVAGVRSINPYQRQVIGGIRLILAAARVDEFGVSGVRLFSSLRDPKNASCESLRQTHANPEHWTEKEMLVSC